MLVVHSTTMTSNRFASSEEPSPPQPPFTLSRTQFLSVPSPPFPSTPPPSLPPAAPPPPPALPPLFSRPRNATDLVRSQMRSPNLDEVAEHIQQTFTPLSSITLNATRTPSSSSANPAPVTYYTPTEPPSLPGSPQQTIQAVTIVGVGLGSAFVAIGFTLLCIYLRRRKRRGGIASSFEGGASRPLLFVHPALASDHFVKT